MTAGSIIAGGFGLVRRHPGAVAIWGLLYLAATAAMALAMRPIMGTLAQMRAGGAGSPVPAEAFSSAMGGLLLIELAILALAMVLFAAAQRAVLQPEREGFAYLRLGMDELRLFGLAVLLVILFYIGLLVSALVVALVVALIAVAAGPTAAIPLTFIAVFALLGMAIWLQVRLSLAFPLTLMRGKIVIGEAWRTTRGHFWTLFLAFLTIFMLLLVLWIAAAMVTSGGYFADIAASGFTPEGIQRAGERQMERQFGAITPTMVIGWIVSGVAGSLSIAVFGGALATGAREAVTDIDGLADTFG
jgi:hypothetical protein